MTDDSAWMPDRPTAVHRPAGNVVADARNILVLPTSCVVADFDIARPINAGQTSSVE